MQDSGSFGAVQPRGNRGSLADHSGATPDAASHVVVPANPGRNYLLIQNNHATDNLWINFGTPALLSQPSILVAAGDTAIWEGVGFMPNEAVHLIAAAAAVTYTIKEG